MLSAALARWFDPVVAEGDRFVKPNFALGQFFYSAQTARTLVDRLDVFESICCLCTPRLAWEWAQRGRETRLLDYDERFAKLPGFRRFDLTRPQPTGEAYDLVVFDPVFLPAVQLERAVSVVTADSDADRLAFFMTFPADREDELLAAFQRYGLRRIPLRLEYNHVRRDVVDLFRLYGNRDLPAPTQASETR